ncbi:hypothetical protein SLS62_007183 [Diatrype stigma]|uniref:Thioredoxin-like protein AAED1 n=1 Tax=Diatrype stigma TaxID=117547 RepID=A0AAN9YR04_9PEZI
MSGAGANNASSAKRNSIPRKAIAPRIQNDTQSGPVTGKGQQNPLRRALTDGRKKKSDASTNSKPAAAAVIAEQDPAPTTTATPTPPPPPSGPAHSSETSMSSRGGGGGPTLGEKPSTLSLTPSASSTVAASNNNNDSFSACGLPPPDFQGEVETNNELPSLETLRKIESYTVLDADGKSHTFKSLYAGHNVARRVMVIFVRHFFCGNCQEYLRILSAAITPDALLQLPVSTFIAVVGCGAPELIAPYVRETGCPFPVYTDPTRRLYAELGMLSTLRMGQKPAYLGGTSFAKLVASSVVQGLRQVRSGLATKMGDQRQVGGEFLFEPATLSLEPPIATPVVDDVAEDRRALLGDDHQQQRKQQQQQQEQPQHRDDAPIGNAEDEKIEPKRVTWCHRMKTTRDHAEVPELLEVLGLEVAEDGTATTTTTTTANPTIVVGSGRSGRSGSEVSDKKKQRYSKALQTRKGTGLSMASQMSRMSLEASAAASITSGGGGGGASSIGGGSRGSIGSVTPNSGRSSISRGGDDVAGIRSVSPANGVPITALAPAPAKTTSTSTSISTAATTTDAVNGKSGAGAI